MSRLALLIVLAAPSPAAAADPVKVVRYLESLGCEFEKSAGGTITGVSFPPCRLSAADLKQLAGLEGLTYLDLSAVSVPDAALGELAALPKLEALAPPGRIGDEGMALVAGLRGLRELFLCWGI